MHTYSLVKKFWNSPTFNTWASLGARSLNLIILIPFILKKFTAAEISLWYLFATIVSLNLLVDVGLGATFTRFIAYSVGKKNDSEDFSLNSIVGTQQVIFAWLTLLVFILLVIVGTLTVCNPINELKDPAEGWICWCVIIIGTCINFRGNAYAIYLQGINRIAEFRRYEAIFSLAAILSSIIILIFEANILELVIVNQLWVVLSAFRNKWLCYKYSNGVFVKGVKLEYDKKILNHIWPSAWRSGLGVLMSYGVTQCSSLIYAQSNQVEQVSAYLFAMRIMQIIITFSQAPFYSKLPLLTSLYAKNDSENIVKLASEGMRRAHITYIIGFISVVVFAEPVMKIIGSNISFIDNKLWILMGIGYAIERYGAMHLQLYSITNHIVWHVANGITGIIYIIITILLYSYIGVYSFPIAMIISYAGFYSWYTAYRSYYKFNLRFKSFEGNTVMLLILTFLISIVVFVLN